MSGLREAFDQIVAMSRSTATSTGPSSRPTASGVTGTAQWRSHCGEQPCWP
jgi:hypothetical protein